MYSLLWLLNEIASAYIIIGACVASFYLLLASCVGLYHVLVIKKSKPFKALIPMDVAFDALWLATCVFIWPFIGDADRPKRWRAPWVKFIKAVRTATLEQDDS